MLLSLSLARSPKDTGVRACVCAHVRVCMCVGMYSKPTSALIPVLARSLCSHGAHLHVYFSTWWILSIFNQLFPPHMNISCTDFSLCPGDLYNSFLWLLLYLSYVSPIKAASVFVVKLHTSFHPKVTAYSLLSPFPLSWWTDSLQNSCDCSRVSENIEYYSWNKKQGQTDICKQINYPKCFM